MRYVLVGDGLSPHLLKWARELHPRVDLWVVSSRGFLADFDSFLPRDKRFAFNARPGWQGWCGVFVRIGELGRWLCQVDADWLNPHYLTSHGLLAVFTRKLYRLRASIVGSAWGSDVLWTPQKGWLQRYSLEWIMSQCEVMTSDSHYMAEVMRSLHACDVLVFPFGLDALPKARGKDERLFFTNRWLEPIYNPMRALKLFKQVVDKWPDAHLVVASTGSLEKKLAQWVSEQELSKNVKFVGYLDAVTQQEFYAAARWFISVPESDAVSVSVLEAMAHGCFPILSDLPANRELVPNLSSGLIVPNCNINVFDLLPKNVSALNKISEKNRNWIKSNALFGPSIELFLKELRVKYENRNSTRS